MARTLLIVDDIKSNREILKNMLGKDYLILEAEHGQEALAIMMNNYQKISAVLLDLGMPVMSGYEVLSCMQGSDKLSQLPVIVTTGQTDADSEEKALKLGAKDYISKPYKSTIIKQRIWNTIKLRETAATVNALHRDRLTGLYSRDAFFEKVQAMVSEHEPGYYTMACFDVDKFKVINDQYGTEKGDDVLKHIAKVFQNGFDPYGGVCCRISADDFAVLYPTMFQNSEQIVKIRKEASLVPGLASLIAFSIGRYVVSDPSITPSAMYDRAMLAADSVKGRYDTRIARYDESMRDHLLHEQEIVTEMEAALNGRQFEVWYQPQYNHSTGSLIGAEALVRWRHPEKGMISPGIFVPVFEKNGFIYSLDRYVWESVCQYLQNEINSGKSPLPVSVNISRYDVFCPDFLDFITGLIGRYDLPVSLLRLEITESAFAEDTKRIVSVVKQLVNFGFTLEIDDFGSGYSSLNTLKSVPAQVVKLDMRFLEDNDDSQRGGNIIESIVRMTKWLGMSVLAEGVETKAQADFLKSIGCNYVQGYLYAKPMPESDYRTLCSKAGKGEKLLALETVENLDNNTFWDPNSMDTLIFNSYVGAACIYEYYQEKIEILRATDKYAQVVGGIGVTVDDVLKLNWMEHMDEDSKNRVIANLEESIATTKEVADEYVFLDLPGHPHETHLRSTMRVIASAGNRYLVYCTNENITAQRQSEKREHEVAEQLQAIMKNINGGVSATTIIDGKLNLIFANDRYYELLGYSKAQYEAQFEGIPNSVLAEDRDMVMERCTAVSSSGNPDSIDFRILRTDGAIRWLRSNVTVMEYPGVNEPVQLSVSTDITEQMEAEQQVRRLSEQMQSIMDNVDLGIIAAVIEDGTARYLFANDHYYKMLGYTKAQFESEIASPYQTIAPEDRQRVIDETARINRDGGSTILVYNAITGDKCKRVFRAAISIGRFSGIDEPVQLSILRDITEEIETEQRERRAAKQVEAMMNDMPGGFVRMRVDADGSIKPTYFNEGFRKLIGMDYDDMVVFYENDALAGVHPDDVPIVKGAIAQMLENGEARSSRYRHRHGNGGYIWLMIFGRMTKDDSGDTFLNVYYSDVTEQVKEEEQRKELLDNLPYGVALYALDKNGPSIIHLNKRYWELVNREETAYSGAAFLDAVYPEDKSIITNELDVALRENRDFICDIRVLYGKNEYRPFHVVGRILRKSDGKYSVYAVYTLITDEAMSVQEMLPIALSAMMDSQTDFSFVKDRNLRYICCSREAAFIANLSSTSEIQGKTDYELFDKAVADVFVSDDRRVFEIGEAVIDHVSRITSRDGSVCYASTSKFPLKDSRGNIVGLYGVGRDITESRAIKSQYELLTNSIPGGIATCEVNGESIHMTYFNDGFCKLFELTREEYLEISTGNIFAGVFAEDLPALRKQLDDFIDGDIPLDCVYRVRLKNSGYKWINLKAASSEKEDNKIVFNAVLFDVTQRQDAMEHLRISEEENRLAMQQTSNTVCRYDVASSTLRVPKSAQEKYLLSEIVEDIPFGQIKRGLISPETADVYAAFYEEIHSGKETGTATFQRMSSHGWCWLEGHYSTILSDDGKPVSAVISFADVTEQLEKDFAYKRWQQSFQSRPADSYSVFRCNIRKKTTFDAREGSLLTINFEPGPFYFDEHTAEYVNQYVFEEDKERFSAFLNVDALLSGYYQGKCIVSLEYREKLTSGNFRWLHLTVDLLEHANPSEVEAYMLFEDIDKIKRQELATMELAQTDPLTGVLNRATFAAQVNNLIQTSKPNTQHALMMLDIDGFKQVNDAFGHGAGDQVLIDIAGSLRTALRHADLIGRLGGDEYLVFLTDIPGDVVASAKAKQICAVMRKAFSAEVEISGSIGIAVTPRDGADFNTLYKKADAALYHVKGSGKDNFAFYHDDMAGQHLTIEKRRPGSVETPPQKKKRRMLIVDDSRIDHALLTNIFADQFLIEKAKNGNDALIRLRHYGTAISVVLLDLMMPGMDGFAVLKSMQESVELQSVPVIVVSGDEHRETSLRAIREGAVDFITKPVDPDILRIRVQSAISKADNERLRAKNSFLEYQNNEVARYRTALDSSGVVVIENDWVAGTFVYDASIAEHIAGKYDNRSFWHILLSDFVAETYTVQKMQGLVQEIASDRTQRTAQMTVRLKTPQKNYHWFRMSVTKKSNEFGLAGKIYMTFVDLGAEKIADQ